VSEEIVRVLVADDHPAFRGGLRGMLSSVDGMEVVGDAANGEECVAATMELRPNVVLMDLHMPVLNGIDATRRITEAVPETAVVVLTMLEDDDSVFAAMRAGACGYLLKGADQNDVVRAINAAASGDVIFGAVIAERVREYFAGSRGGDSSRAFPELTERELEVLELIARGEKNQVIAEKLFVSEKTVRNHVSNIFAKLRVADRSEAIVRAREAGLGREQLRGE
jgi:DNA-binding NarL/FixJ family response regulator